MARSVNRMGDPLAPGFLVAMPQLADPNFHRSVVLMLRHTDAGAFGVVINRPGEVAVKDLLEDQEIPYAGPGSERIMIGGPVELDRHLLVLHGEPPAGENQDELPVTNGVSVVTSRDGLVRLAASAARRYRCYLGYAGWGPGQIESELADGSWIALPADARLIFDEPPENVWEMALRAGGIDPVTLVPGGELN